MRNKRGNATIRKNERPGTPKKKPECLMKAQERQTKQENIDKERKKKAVVHLCGTKICELLRMT
jgi:hypothetical protein